MAIKFKPKEPDAVPAAEKARKLPETAADKTADAATAKSGRPKAKKPANPAVKKDGELF